MRRRPIWWWAGIAVAAGLVAIQFVPGGAVNPPITQDLPAPPEVKAILRRACYDCHSHETRWPWYGRVAPFSWRVAREVSAGRAKLNFSTWDQYSTQQQVERMRQSWTAATEARMPPWFYGPFHATAGLTRADQEVLRRWAAGPPARP